MIAGAVVLASIAVFALPIIQVDVRVTRKAREAALRHNLVQIREMIGAYRADKGRYPVSLDALVNDGGYFRRLPRDPVTGQSAWYAVVVANPGPDSTGPGVIDVRSLAEGKGLDGTPYGEW